jgi:hypothetical protein
MKNSFTRLIVLGIFSLSIAAIVAERVAAMWVEKRISRFAASHKLGLESVKVNLFGSTLRAYNVEWRGLIYDGDSVSEPFKAEKVTARGVGILDLARDRSLHVRTLIIENGNLPFHATTRQQERTTVLELSGLSVEALRLTNTAVTYQDSTSTWSGVVDLTLNRIGLREVSLPYLASSYDGQVVALTVHNAKLERPKRFFTVTVARIDFDREKGKLSCDSVHIQPLHSKLEFARIRGTQSTWANVVVPRIEARGLDMKYHQDTTLTASHIRIVNPRIAAFRDRRVPLRRKSEIPLPMKWMRDLDLAVEIDSIEVDDMEVVYEHFSEEAFEPGVLRFRQLNAMFLNVYNRAYNNTRPVTTLYATSAIMGGKIQAQFSLPLQPGVPYEARGKITKLPLTELNPMLENAAFVSIESGVLNALDFRFNYNNDLSTGEVSIDYEGLKVKGLKKDKEGSENQVKSLVVNTALRNNNSKTGAINNERDKRRFIFHYWATSLMDGIRDAVMPAAGEKKQKEKGFQP